MGIPVRKSEQVFNASESGVTIVQCPECQTKFALESNIVDDSQSSPLSLFPLR